MIKNKKAAVIIFFKELLIIILFIVLIFLAAKRIMDYDGKYMEYDSKNFALFLERIPSMTGNFEYNYSFETPKRSYRYNEIYIKIDQTAVHISGDKSHDKKHTSNYVNPEKFRIDQEFSNVKNLIIYKINDEIFIRESFSESKRNKIHSLKTEEYQSTKKINYFSEIKEDYDSENIQEYVFLNLCDELEKNRIFYLVNINTEIQENIIIYYSLSANSLAKNIYNLLINYEKNVLLLPINKKSKIVNNYDCIEKYIDQELILIEFKNNDLLARSISRIYTGVFSNE